MSQIRPFRLVANFVGLPMIAVMLGGGFFTPIEASPLTFDYTTQGSFRMFGHTFQYGHHVPSVTYTVSRPLYDENWQVSTVPDPPLYLTPLQGLAGGSAFDNAVEAAFPENLGWSFTANSFVNFGLSDDSLVVRDYDALHDEGKHTAGGDIFVSYVPHGNDPAPGDVHWVQVFESSPTPGAGKPVVDNGGPTRPYPYYDELGTANGQFFYDYSTRPDDVSNVWEAWLFLVTGPPVVNGQITPGPVTLLGGIEWGWENHCVSDCSGSMITDEPPALGLLIASLPLLVWCYRRTH